MTDAEMQPLAIYETLVVTCKDRPMHFQTVEQMRRESTAWKATNPAFMEKVTQ